MVFQFEHMDVDADGSNKWSDKKMDLRDMKQVLTKWQKGLEEIAWNSLFWENHDQPRSVSRFGNDGEYREMSAKMLATCLHMMQGTPYVYQGQELGMTNVPFGVFLFKCPVICRVIMKAVGFMDPVQCHSGENGIF